jgi:hypothetical protein
MDTSTATTGSPILDHMADDIATIAAKWFIEGRYTDLDEAIAAAAIAYGTAFEAALPQHARAAVDMWERARKSG